MKDLFSEYSYEQLVKTKKKQNVVEIIESDNFFSLLQEVGLLRSVKPGVRKDLEKFLCLD